MAVDRMVVAAARRAGEAAGVDPAVLLAVALVETRGVALAVFDGRAEPLIRFEGHYFDRLLVGPARQRARAEGLAHPRAGAVANPGAQSARWRLFERAAAIDAAAAIASTSWGLCQVMGAHWQALGYGSAEEFRHTARLSADGQFAIGARFLKLGHLHRRLADGDHAGFARRYNGPAYKRNRYDEKIAAAWREAGRLLAATAEEPTLARGARGEAVELLQAGLRQHGQAITVDGMFGALTEAAVRAFQHSVSLAGTGIADAATLEKLARPPFAR
ncbi:MAG: N-acetylmuramidase domain-containing protein [Aurantimonas endophytica]|uniref:N-acetylmuramidase domain-containing protein n=1 Tax=Aurantimonas endophytica TaxID=1522175 RepID=UPI003001BC68